ncbi:TOMM precursor leader peptide-binding protein [Streptomyces cinereoruber]|uniref:TOMM precursor leader peptide-binding protein n=1 Tax=Streptomyces cinereoruber TaxID=67260 RepID=UPI003C2E84E1
MHPMVKPALRRAWRSLRCVQFGVTPAHAVVLDPVGPETEAVLGLPDGRLDALLGRLESAGLLTDAAAGRPGRAGPAAGAADAALDPLRADLASLSVVHSEPERAAGVLAARRALRVQVRGAGRVGATVAALLAAAGVGRVEVVDSGRVEPWETAPGGLPAEAVGERRATAARRLAGRWSRGAPRGGGRGGGGTGPGDRKGGAGAGPGGRAEAGRHGRGDGNGGGGLSLVVVAPRDGLGAYVPDPLPAQRWVSAGVPHLYAGVVEATGTVGPLVLPGGTACARCLQEERTDREPVRPRLLAQWRSGAPHPLPACDLALATAVAGLAAAHALAFLDGDLPASTGTRWEASLPFLEWRAERLRPHPACPCGAARGREGELASAAEDAHDTMAG